MDKFVNQYLNFLKTYIFPKQVSGYKDLYVDRLGRVYNSEKELTPYKYRDDSHYDSLYVRDLNDVPHVVGIHQLVSQTYDPDYYPGCVVHHKDENKYNNYDTNLEVNSRSQHALHHSNQIYFDKIQVCQVCGKEFVWDSKRQQQYYSDLRRGRSRIITCSKQCSSYYGRMTQLGKHPDMAK